MKKLEEGLMLPGCTGETCTLFYLFQSSAVSPPPRGNVLSCTLTPPPRLRLQTGWLLSTNPAQTCSERDFLLYILNQKKLHQLLRGLIPWCGFPKSLSWPLDLYKTRVKSLSFGVDHKTQVPLVQHCWIIIDLPWWFWLEYDRLHEYEDRRTAENREFELFRTN